MQSPPIDVGETLFRNLLPNHVKKESVVTTSALMPFRVVATSAFMPSSSDGTVSVDRAAITTQQESFDLYNLHHQPPKQQAVASCSVIVQSLLDNKLNCVPTPTDPAQNPLHLYANPAHASVVFPAELSKGDKTRLARKLAEIATTTLAPSPFKIVE
jgi:hypothetical protein